jgi:hypothetical protein
MRRTGTRLPAALWTSLLLCHAAPAQEPLPGDEAQYNAQQRTATKQRMQELERQMKDAEKVLPLGKRATLLIPLILEHREVWNDNMRAQRFAPTPEFPEEFDGTSYLVACGTEALKPLVEAWGRQTQAEARLQHIHLLTLVVSGNDEARKNMPLDVLHAIGLQVLTEANTRNMLYGIELFVFLSKDPARFPTVQPIVESFLKHEDPHVALTVALMVPPELRALHSEPYVELLRKSMNYRQLVQPEITAVLWQLDHAHFCAVLPELLRKPSTQIGVARGMARLVLAAEQARPAAMRQRTEQEEALCVTLAAMVQQRNADLPSRLFAAYVLAYLDPARHAEDCIATLFEGCASHPLPATPDGMSFGAGAESIPGPLRYLIHFDPLHIDLMEPLDRYGQRLRGPIKKVLSKGDLPARIVAVRFLPRIFVTDELPLLASFLEKQHPLTLRLAALESIVVLEARFQGESRRHPEQAKQLQELRRTSGLERLVPRASALLAEVIDAPWDTEITPKQRVNTFDLLEMIDTQKAQDILRKRLERVQKEGGRRDKSAEEQWKQRLEVLEQRARELKKAQEKP